MASGNEPGSATREFEVLLKIHKFRRPTLPVRWLLMGFL